MQRSVYIQHDWSNATPICSQDNRNDETRSSWSIASPASLTKSVGWRMLFVRTNWTFGIIAHGKHLTWSSRNIIHVVTCGCWTLPRRQYYYRLQSDNDWDERTCWYTNLMAYNHVWPITEPGHYSGWRQVYVNGELLVGVSWLVRSVINIILRFRL